MSIMSNEIVMVALKSIQKFRNCVSYNISNWWRRDEAVIIWKINIKPVPIFLERNIFGASTGSYQSSASHTDQIYLSASFFLVSKAESPSYIKEYLQRIWWGGLLFSCSQTSDVCMCIPVLSIRVTCHVSRITSEILIKRSRCHV